MMIAMVVVILWMGIYPQPFLRRMDQTVNQMVEHIGLATTSITPMATQAATRQPALKTPAGTSEARR